MNTNQQKIEALLFFKNEPLSYTWLAKQLSLGVEELAQEVQRMVPFYEGRGIQMVLSDDGVSLLSASSASALIQELTKSDEERDLSKQALETLAIILYKKEVTKSEIDYIRGVNSVFILRNLLLRGLIQKKPNTEDRRSPYYTATHDTLAFLGLSRVEELPRFEEFVASIESIHRDWEREQKEDQLPE